MGIITISSKVTKMEIQTKKEIKELIKLLLKKKFVVKDNDLEFQTKKIEDKIVKLAKEIFEEGIMHEEYQINLYILGSILINTKSFILLSLKEIANVNQLSIDKTIELIKIGEEKNRFWILRKDEMTWYFFLPTDGNKKLLEKFRNEI